MDAIHCVFQPWSVSPETARPGSDFWSQVSYTHPLEADGHGRSAVGRRGAEYAWNENALHKAYRAKVTKHHTWLKVYVEITENESNCK